MEEYTELCKIQPEYFRQNINPTIDRGKVFYHTQGDHAVSFQLWYAKPKQQYLIILDAIYNGMKSPLEAMDVAGIEVLNFEQQEEVWTDIRKILNDKTICKLVHECIPNKKF